LKLARTKDWRESHGLTQRELAAEAGVGEVTVARIETGASVTPPTARKIAEALSVSVADLLERPPVPLAEAPQETELTYEEAAEQLERQLARRNHGYLVIAKGLTHYAQRWRRRLAAGDFDEDVLEELVAGLEDFAPSVEANLAAERRELAERYDTQSLLSPAIEELSLLVREALDKVDAEQARKLVSIEGRLEVA
jgi:transcriptional regulator with XRE-family HTH domain